ncbi:hypothetical protein [Spongiibacter sp.]|uniref:hypothetical protein n=1 Tax=Spongiibacter sp. TaxID=2024860 RepID=UPI00356B2213
MTTLFTIIGLLFISLFVLLPIIEKYAPKTSVEQQQRLSRWILPLVAVGIVLALIKHLTS